ncbi:MAG: hypothetical protein COY78_06950 [Candidatus Omnitrophica bacterium CG_4_10_14_0_8_um_filter_44_12]|nr:MAG: hypothetical protein COY78_06950 [Candidatus Omnitrophica bacterium CG_4_10_14_0_8_um_filter_44_12]
MVNKIIMAICFFVFVEYCIIPKTVFASETKQVVEDCLRVIKNKDYEKSYEYFSSSLKNEVTLGDHVANLKDIEKNLGRLVDYSDKMPIFRNYVLDEYMFKGLFDKKQQLEYRYFLKYEKGILVAYIELLKEGSNYKINSFYLDTLESRDMITNE